MEESFKSAHKLNILVNQLMKIDDRKDNLVTFAQNGFEMKKLTKKEDEIMNLFWDKGAMFVKELIEQIENGQIK